MSRSVLIDLGAGRILIEDKREGSTPPEPEPEQDIYDDPVEETF